MDYGFLNFLGITVMMIFGLWAFHRGDKKREERRDRKEKRRRGLKPPDIQTRS